MKQEIIVDPEGNDILCAKDKKYNKHTGNQTFRVVIERWAETYLDCRTKNEKTKITRKIVTIMKADFGSRFIKPVVNSEGQDIWVEISDAVARDKVSHALRFAAKRQKKSMKLLKSKMIHFESQSDQIDEDEVDVTPLFQRQQAILRRLQEEESPSNMENCLEEWECLQKTTEEGVDNVDQRKNSMIVKSETLCDLLMEPLSILSKSPESPCCSLRPIPLHSSQMEEEELDSFFGNEGLDSFLQHVDFLQ